MGPFEFEDYVKRLLEEKYDCEVVKPPNNQQGYDLEMKMKKDGKSIAVQVKYYRRNVDIRAVKKLLISWNMI